MDHNSRCEIKAVRRQDMGKTRATIVTGGSRGIGAAIVRRLSGDGAVILNLDREAPNGASSARHIKVDLGDRAALGRTLAEITAEYDVTKLVNNAAIVLPASVEETTLTDFDRVLAIDLAAVVQLTQAVLPAMKASGSGRIVNITSRVVLGKELRTSYAAAKAALVGLTRTWALELGKHGITVNAIGPGPIDTELFRSANPPDSPRTKAIVAGVPVKRLGTPDDIANAVAFFADNANSFVTGQVLYVCGGMTVGAAPV